MKNPSADIDKMAKLEIIRDRCKGCGICCASCPKKLLKLGEERNRNGYRVIVLSAPQEYTGCAICAEMCPDVAITVWR